MPNVLTSPRRTGPTRSRTRSSAQPGFRTPPTPARTSRPEPPPMTARNPAPRRPAPPRRCAMSARSPQPGRDLQRASESLRQRLAVLGGPARCSHARAAAAPIRPRPGTPRPPYAKRRPLSPATGPPLRRPRRHVLAAAAGSLAGCDTAPRTHLRRGLRHPVARELIIGELHLASPSTCITARASSVSPLPAAQPRRADCGASRPRPGDLSERGDVIHRTTSRAGSMAATSLLSRTDRSPYARSVVCGGCGDTDGTEGAPAMRIPVVERVQPPSLATSFGVTPLTVGGGDDLA